MAAACLRTTNAIGNHIKSALLSRTANPVPLQYGSIGVLHQLLIVRNGSFFNKKSAESVWDSVTGVSNAGRKRGRASRGKKMRREDLNRGQKIGVGKSGIQFPGLSAPLLQNGSISKIKESDFIKSMYNNKQERKGKRSRFSRKITPLQRGYSGGRFPGRSVGPPDLKGDFSFKGFNTIVLESKIVGNVTASQGNVFNSSVLVVTGNGNGLAGFAFAKASTFPAALRNARNKAAAKLLYFERYEDRTLWHNFHEHYHKTKITAYRRQDGHGLVCHRVIKSICQVVGIKDLYAKTEGRTKNILSVTRAFFNGLHKQETYDELAERLNHHIVEVKPELSYYPIIKSSPSPDNKSDFVKSDVFNFENYFFGDRVPLKKPKKPFYHNFQSYKKKQFDLYKTRNQMKAKRNRTAMGIDDYFLKQEQ